MRLAKLWHGNRGIPGVAQTGGLEKCCPRRGGPFGSSQPGFIAPGCESQWAGRSMSVIGGLPHGPSDFSTRTGGPSAGRNGGHAQTPCCTGISQWLRPINKFSLVRLCCGSWQPSSLQFHTMPRRRRRFMAWPCLRGGKRGQAPFAGTALRRLRTKGACPLFPVTAHWCCAKNDPTRGSFLLPGVLLERKQCCRDARAQRAIKVPRPWLFAFCRLQQFEDFGLLSFEHR